MSFLPTSNRSGILAGVYLVNAVVAPLAIFYSVSVSPHNHRNYDMVSLTHPASGPLPTLEALRSELLPLLSSGAHFLLET